jgi:hypothetical protein
LPVKLELVETTLLVKPLLNKIRNKTLFKIVIPALIIQVNMVFCTITYA